MNLDKVREYLTYFKIYYDRGGSLTNLGRNIVMFAMAFKIYNIGAVESFILAGIVSIGFIGLGYVDHRWGIFSNEQGKMTGHINPHLKKVSDDLELIKGKLEVK